MMVQELPMEILLIKTVQPIFAKMYYVLFTRIEETQLLGLLFAKVFLELVLWLKS